MPYSSISQLPPAVQSALPGKEAKERFKGAFNSCVADGGSESKCFQVAYGAARKTDKSDLPVGKALVMAKRHLPGWAWGVIQRNAFEIPTFESVKKSRCSLQYIRKLFSFSHVQHIKGEAHDSGVAPVYAKAIIARLNNRELISKALGVSRATMPGWAVAVLQAHLLGPRAPVVFIGKDLEGKAREVFDQVYLPLLGNPVYSIAHKSSEVDCTGSVIVALGKEAAKGFCDAKLPHPRALLIFGDSGEVSRKTDKIKKMIDTTGHITQKSTQAARFNARLDDEQPLQGDSSNRFIVPISKADQDLQVVTGVVLQPFEEAGDSQGDVLTPKVIEAAAHVWMSKSRLIGVEHSKKAKGAVPVESYLVPYPTVDDYKKATADPPQKHNAYKMALGGDVVTSGSWVVSTKLDDSLWKAFKSGEIQAYSIGGYGKRDQHEPTAIPEINYVESLPNE